MSLSSEIQELINLLEGSKPKTFAVLVTGNPPDPKLEEIHGDYGKMTIDLLKNNPNEIWLTYDCKNDEFPSDSDLKQISGFAITGSKHDSYDNNIPWILKLRKFIRDIYTKKSHKMIGLCFGHQIIAHSLNDGLVSKANVGWEIGLKKVKTNENFKKIFPNFSNIKDFKLYQSHQDQVMKLPDNALLLGSSDRTPNEMFIIDDLILGVQGHPEFNKSYAYALIDRRHKLKRYKHESDITVKALKSIEENENSNENMQKLLQYFLSH